MAKMYTGDKSYERGPGPGYTAGAGMTLPLTYQRFLIFADG